jgi:transcription-repair coupling factor (superfamily II helicase)
MPPARQLRSAACRLSKGPSALSPAAPALPVPAVSPGASAPLAALLPTVLADPGLREVVAAAGRDVAVEGPTGLRPFLAAALGADADAPEQGAGVPVLVVTATEREAEELATAVGELLGADAVAYLPSW